MVPRPESSFQASARRAHGQSPTAPRLTGAQSSIGMGARSPSICATRRRTARAGIVRFRTIPSTPNPYRFRATEHVGAVSRAWYFAKMRILLLECRVLLFSPLSTAFHRPAGVEAPEKMNTISYAGTA